MLSYDDAGRAGITLKYSGALLSSVQTIPSSLYAPITPFYFHFQAGNPQLGQGTLFHANWSNCYFKVLDWVIYSGTLAASTAKGIMLVTPCYASSTNVASDPTIPWNTASQLVPGEPIMNVASIMLASVATPVVTIPGWRDPFKGGFMCTGARLTSELWSIRVTWCGVGASGNVTSGIANFGHLLSPNYNSLVAPGFIASQPFELRNENNIIRLTFCNDNNASQAVANLTLFYGGL